MDDSNLTFFLCCLSGILIGTLNPSRHTHPKCLLQHQGTGRCSTSTAKRCTRTSKPAWRTCTRFSILGRVRRPPPPAQIWPHISRRTNHSPVLTHLSSTGDIDALISGRKVRPPPPLPHMTRHVLTPPQYIQALIPAVVNIVYKKLLQYDITARAFTTRSTSFEGPMDETPDEESPQILHRKKFLSGYLKKLCSDPAQMEFFEYLDKVGMMHTGIGRAVPLHIEYVHIGAALGVIQDVFNEALLSHPRLSMQRKLAMVKALGKIIWIQNDLFAKWYVHDGEEYTAGVDYAGVVEKEGWLKGKKVLDDVDEEVDGAGKAARGNESDGSDDTAVSPRRAAGLKGGCPFAGVVAGGKKVMFDEGGMEEGEVGK